MSIRNFPLIITTILLSISFSSNGFEFPKYPEILTPNEQYSALANTDHAAIKYGDDDKAKVLTNQFNKNGYHDYHYKDEESTDESLGLKDVIHSVGALLSIVQTFPTLGDSFENKYLDHHSHKNTNQNTNTHSHEIPMGHESKVQTKFEVTSTNTNIPVPPPYQTTFGGKDSSPLPTSTYYPTSPSFPNPSVFPTSSYGNVENSDTSWVTLNQVDRRQCTYSDQIIFPCSGPDVRPSFYKPTSVHRLRPGDIQIIAGLGDALISGQGALASGITSVTRDYRGVSFATGGDGNWRTTLTLPNILKEFNPRLKGFSTGNSKSGIRGLNLGMDNAVSSDLESQVEELISKIKRNPNLSLRDDWKLIFLNIGQNDLCRLSCRHNGTVPHFGAGNNQIQSPEDFVENVKRGLDKLMRGLPRSLVSLILPTDPTLTMEAFHRPIVCHLTSKVLCPCVDGPKSIGRLQMLQLVEEYRQALYDLLANEEFQQQKALQENSNSVCYFEFNHLGNSRSQDIRVEIEGYDRYEDFAVVIQPGLTNLELPKNHVTFFGIHKSFLPDLSYLSSDCFHPSQKLHALYAKNIWNNLLEPVGTKSDWSQFSNLKCPSSQRPFLATNKNSAELSDEFDDVDDTEEDEPFQRKRLVRRRKKKLNKRSPSPIPYMENELCDIL